MTPHHTHHPHDANNASHVWCGIRVTVLAQIVHDADRKRDSLHETVNLHHKIQPSDHMSTADSSKTTAVGLVKTTLGNQSAPFAQQPCNHSCGTRASLTWVSAGLEMTCTIFTFLRTPTKHITPAPTHQRPLDPNRTGQTPHPQRHECPHQRRQKRRPPSST